jgi:hypothetical protein
LRPALRNCAPQATQRGVDGRRVMGEIVIDPHAPHLAQQFLTSLHALETLQCLAGHTNVHTSMVGCRHCCQRVAHVVDAAQGPAHVRGNPGHPCRGLAQFKLAAIGVQRADKPRQCFIPMALDIFAAFHQVQRLALTPAALGQHGVEIVVIPGP